ncbi:MAG: hypothetical protein D6798_03840 [Deltaproteobacteria bacterium]|nr:MAG: hypothetical protein D6798_03840 [Deltaproteobacteria bacterium]
MGDLSVCVRLNGVVVEDRTLRVDRLVHIGESPSAVVSFPGADLAVVRTGRRLMVRGRDLEEGDTLFLKLGAVDVRLEHTMRASTPPAWHEAVDRRFLVVVALVTGIGTWCDAAGSWADRNPLGLAVREESAPVEPLGGEASFQRTSLVATGEAVPPAGGDVVEDVADGPRHIPDDPNSGTAWYAWYRRAVPEDPLVLDAYARLEHDPTDVAAHQVVARAAYGDDEFDAAVWHYRWLVHHGVRDRDTLLRLARAEQRRGRHATEVSLYEQVLAEDPTDVDALAGLTVALARLGRLDEAVRKLDSLQAAAPMSPVTELTVATIAALQGQDRDALDALDRAIASRGQLSDEMQVELRRELALDPAFSGLRKDKRMRALLHRHLGAAAPTPMRTKGPG